MGFNKSLHGLRGALILCVLIAHIHDGAKTGGFFAGFSDTSLAGSFYWALHRSVDWFFLLSGFLIPACVARNGAGFLWGRAKRIYPVYFAAHLLIFVVGPIIGYKWLAGLSPLEYLQHFLSNLLFLPGVFPLPLAQIVAWTLSYDVAFYLLCAMAWGLWNSKSPWLLRGLGWSVWLAGVVGVIGYTQAGHQCWYFVAGAVAYYLYAHRNCQFQSFWMVSVVGPAAAIGGMICYWHCFWLSPLLAIVAVLAFAAERGWTATVLRSRPAIYLGNISYSFYLWHPFALFALKRVFVRWGALLGPTWLQVTAFGLASLAVSLAVSHLSWKTLENKPLQQLADWLARRRDNAALAAEADDDQVILAFPTAAATTKSARPASQERRAA